MRALLGVGEQGLRWLCGRAAASSTAAAVVAAPAILPLLPDAVIKLWPTQLWTERCRFKHSSRDKNSPERQERDQQLADALYAAHGELGFSRDFFVKIIRRRCIRVTPEQFEESFSMLQQVTDAHDPKQQEALVRSLKVLPKVLMLLPDTVQVKATALKQQLLQQLGVDPVQSKQLIRRHPTVLEYRADSLIRKATEQGQLLHLAAADVVVQLWTRHRQLIKAGTQLLHANLAQLQLLLQPYMSPANVQQLVLSQPGLLSSHTPDAVRVRLKALQECLPDWTPQQLGAALLKYASVLLRSPDTIRHKWRTASQYRDLYMLRTQKEKQQQQPEQPPQASKLGLFIRAAERYAALKYIMMQQQQQQQHRSELVVDSTGSTVSSSSQGLISSSNDEAHSSYVPPMLIVLTTSKLRFDRLLQEHYPGFQQWHKQRQQAVEKQGQQPK